MDTTLDRKLALDNAKGGTAGNVHSTDVNVGKKGQVCLVCSCCCNEHRDPSNPEVRLYGYDTRQANVRLKKPHTPTDTLRPM